MLLKYTTEGEHNIHCNVYQNPSKIDLKMFEIHINFHRILNSPNSTKQEKKAGSFILTNLQPCQSNEDSVIMTCKRNGT